MPRPSLASGGAEVAVFVVAFHDAGSTTVGQQETSFTVLAGGQSETDFSISHQTFSKAQHKDAVLGFTTIHTSAAVTGFEADETVGVVAEKMHPAWSALSL